jgi:hypothetical protein
MDIIDYELRLVYEQAEKGNPMAMMDVCQRFFDTKDYQNHELVKKYLEILSEHNSKRAMLLLGNMYYTGKGVEKSYKEAAMWYEKAADLHEPYGLCNLGYCYSYGRDMPVDHAKAYECFSKSAYLGNANAMYKLGDMYFHGQHVSEDKNAAFYWYSEALDKGYGDIEVEPNINYRLGKCYLHGYGTEIDALRALEHLQNSELDFFKLIKAGDTFAELTILQVRVELDNARSMIYHAIRMD